MNTVFVGYDKAEPVAFHTCVESLITNSSEPLSIVPLYKKQLNFKGPKIKKDYPQSNEFIFTRFLIPQLMSFTGLAVWLDGDMVVESDISELFKMPMNNLGVRVVKHDYKTTAKKKYLGAKNDDYPCKNWSSVILWNCSYFPHRRLTPDLIKESTGEYLHRFQWLGHSEVGELPKEWNVIADEPNQATNPKLIHYSLGTPCFNEYSQCQYSENWYKHHLAANYCKQLYAT